MDSGTCIFSRFATDTKLCVAFDVLEGQNVIQRDLHKLERWSYANLMKCSKVLHPGRGNPKQKHLLDNELSENGPEEKDLGILVDEKLDMSQ